MEQKKMELEQKNNLICNFSFDLHIDSNCIAQDTKHQGTYLGI